MRQPDEYRKLRSYCKFSWKNFFRVIGGAGRWRRLLLQRAIRSCGAPNSREAIHGCLRQPVAVEAAPSVSPDAGLFRRLALVSRHARAIRSPCLSCLSVSGWLPFADRQPRSHPSPYGSARTNPHAQCASNPLMSAHFVGWIFPWRDWLSSTWPRDPFRIHPLSTCKRVCLIIRLRSCHASVCVLYVYLGTNRTRWKIYIRSNNPNYLNIPDVIFFHYSNIQFAIVKVQGDYG